MRTRALTLVSILLAGVALAEKPNPPATQPTRQPAKSLSQVLDDLSATDEQRAKVTQAMQAGSRAWRSWWNANHQQLEDFADQARKAAEQKDTDKVKQIQAKGRALAMTMPKSADTWDQIKPLFPQASAQQLESISTDAKRAIDRELHSAVKGEVFAAGKTGMGACTGCHMPIQRT